MIIDSYCDCVRTSELTPGGGLKRVLTGKQEATKAALGIAFSCHNSGSVGVKVHVICALIDVNINVIHKETSILSFPWNYRNLALIM